ncbi:hypothetical protein EVC24_135 [Rhizobium phage RHph_I4]|nr:hypothetical protein EVC24_135 [Rhizobium phage RHph_I4]
MSRRHFKFPSRIWLPFVKATPVPPTPEQIEAVVKAFPQMTREEIERQFAETANCIIWQNNLYQVQVREQGPITHLSIKRTDKLRIGPERYRDLMRIRDEIVGPEREAVEIYPARSREVDTANQYHLWVLPEGSKIPFGFDQGRVVNNESVGGAVQHPFD